MGNTPPLIAAVDRGDDLEVRNLLSDPATDCEKTNCSGQTAIHVAARRGNALVLNMLLRNPHHRPELNRLDMTRGYAPLHYAAAYSHLDCVTALLVAGADPRIRVAIGSRRAGRVPAALVGKHARRKHINENRIRALLDRTAALAAARQPPEQTVEQTRAPTAAPQPPELQTVEQTRAPAAALQAHGRTPNGRHQQRVHSRQQRAAGHRTLPPTPPQCNRPSAPPQYSRSQAVVPPPPYTWSCAHV